MSSSCIIDARISDEFLKQLFEQTTERVNRVPVPLTVQVKTSIYGFESDLLVATELHSKLLGDGICQGTPVQIGSGTYALSWAHEHRVQIPPPVINPSPPTLSNFSLPRQQPKFMAYEETKPVETNPLVELRNALLRCQKEGVSAKDVDDTYNLVVAEWVMNQ